MLRVSSHVVDLLSPRFVVRSFFSALFRCPPSGLEHFPTRHQRVRSFDLGCPPFPPPGKDLLNPGLSPKVCPFFGHLWAIVISLLRKLGPGETDNFFGAVFSGTLDPCFWLIHPAFCMIPPFCFYSLEMIKGLFLRSPPHPRAPDFH